ncbi:MAG: hypothetical protein ABL889_17805 [Terricaulis sp.]
MTTDNYEERFVAFVDILGFGDWVVQAHKSAEMRGAIAESLKRAQELYAAQSAETGLAFHFFSDSIIASSRLTVEGLWHLLLSLDSLTWNLLQQDVWVRGAVAVGGVFVDPAIVFGTGINRAYRLESTLAKFPRIILSRDVVGYVSSLSNEAEWANVYAGSRVRRDSDGVYYLHFLTELAAANATAKPGSKAEEELVWLVKGKEIRDQLQYRIDAAVEAPDVYAKAKWMADYWNREVVRDRSPNDVVIGRVNTADDVPRPLGLPFRGSF